MYIMEPTQQFTLRNLDEVTTRIRDKMILKVVLNNLTTSLLTWLDPQVDQVTNSKLTMLPTGLDV